MIKFKRIVDDINKCPVTYLPGLLVAVVQRCVKEHVFIEGKIGELVSHQEAIISANTKPNICPHYYES